MAVAEATADEAANAASIEASAEKAAADAASTAIEANPLQAASFTTLAEHCAANAAFRAALDACLVTSLMEFSATLSLCCWSRIDASRQNNFWVISSLLTWRALIPSATLLMKELLYGKTI